MEQEDRRGSEKKQDVAQLEQRRQEEINRMAPGVPSLGEEKGESSEGQKIYSYYCRQEGNYSNQCLLKIKEKQLTVNMVIAQVMNL